jgi:hypothetical protein
VKFRESMFSFNLSNEFDFGITRWPLWIPQLRRIYAPVFPYLFIRFWMVSWRKIFGQREVSAPLAIGQYANGLMLFWFKNFTNLS